MMNKKGIALILVKPALWLLYIMIVVIFLILFTIGGLGSSGRDESRVTVGMPDFITTIEALNYLRTPVGDTTVGDLIIKSVKKKDTFGKIDFSELETKTNQLITLEDYDFENEKYTYEDTLGREQTAKEEHHTITLRVNKEGETQEVVFYLPSNLKDHSYIKLIMEMPYEK